LLQWIAELEAFIADDDILNDVTATLEESKFDCDRLVFANVYDYQN